MRRGGGSRGGRSSGRSSSRSSSRMSSSSRRHYYGGRHHRGYYGGGYYGGYHSRRANPIIFLFIFGIIGLIIIAAIAAALGGNSVRADDLEPGEMALIKSDGFSSVTIAGGSITSYFFSSRPVNLGSLDYSFTESATIAADNYYYWEDFYVSGAQVTVIWSSDTEMDFSLIIGSKNFKDWEDGDITESYRSSAITGSYTYTTTSEERLYFAFENTSFNSHPISVLFDVITPLFNTLLARETESGVVNEKDIDFSYIVIENSGITLTAYTITLEKQFGFWPIFLVLLVLFGLLMYWIGKKISKGSRNVPSQIRQPTGYSTYGTQTLQNQQVNQQNFQPPPQTYVQRPTPKYCGNCGTSILSDTKFCASCGQRSI